MAATVLVPTPPATPTTAGEPAAAARDGSVRESTNDAGMATSRSGVVIEQSLRSGRRRARSPPFPAVPRRVPPSPRAVPPPFPAWVPRCAVPVPASDARRHPSRSPQKREQQRRSCYPGHCARQLLASRASPDRHVQPCSRRVRRITRQRSTSCGCAFPATVRPVRAAGQFPASSPPPSADPP